MAATLLQMLAALLSTAAGGALLVCWKINGRALPAGLGVGFVTLGVLSLAAGRLEALTLHVAGATDPFGQLVPCALAAVAIARALWAPEVDSRLKPLRAVTINCVGGLLLLAIFGPAMHDWPAGQSIAVVTRLMCALIWVVVAVLVFVALRSRRALVGSWVAAYLMILAGVQGLAVMTLDVGYGRALLATGFLAVASLAFSGAFRDLSRMFGSQEGHLLGVRSAVEQLRAERQAETAELDERVHDMRNAVAGIRTANETLNTYSEDLDAETRAWLSDSVSSELGRLQGLLESNRDHRVKEFGLLEALSPVLTTARTDGMQAVVDLGNHRVLGDQGSLAQAVQNLVTNAGRYAPGSLVSITAERAGAWVRIRIEDSGPGIPLDERATVFERGARGRNAFGSDGSGLGLFIARRLMTDMGGCLRLDPQGRGACFVIELPAAGMASVEDTQVEGKRVEDQRVNGEDTPGVDDPALRPLAVGTRSRAGAAA